MVSKSNLIFSKAAASRILDISKNLIAGFKIFSRVCWVWVRGVRPTFISKIDFLKHFAEYRQEQAKSIPVSVWPDMPNWFKAEGSNDVYPVVLETSGPECACEDYKNQIILHGKGVCKHGYAVLKHLGYGSLREFLAA